MPRHPDLSPVIPISERCDRRRYGGWMGQVAGSCICTSNPGDLILSASSRQQEAYSLNVVHPKETRLEPTSNNSAASRTALEVSFGVLLSILCTDVADSEWAFSIRIELLHARCCIQLGRDQSVWIPKTIEVMCHVGESHRIVEGLWTVCLGSQKPCQEDNKSIAR